MSRLLLLASGGTSLATVDVGVRGVAASGDPTGATDTAALNAAISELATLGGGEVRYGTGLVINSPVIGRRGVVLSAVGGSQFTPNVKLAPASNCPMLTLAENTTSFVMEGGVWDGDRFNQAGTAGGFILDTEYYGGTFGSCAFNKIKGTIVQFPAGDGIKVGGQGAHSGQVEDRLLDVIVYGPSGTGLKVSNSDMFIDGLTVAESGQWGVDLAGSDIKIDNAKVFYAGRMRTARDGTGTEGPGGGSYGGYIFNVSGIQANNLSAQDCTGVALGLSGTGGHVQIHSDGNAVGAGSGGAALGVGYCTDTVVDLTMSHTSGHYVTPYVLRMNGNTARNRVRAIVGSDAAANPTQQAPGSAPDATDRVSIGAANI